MESPISRLKTCLSLSLCPQAGAHRDSLSPYLEEPPRWKGGRLAKQLPARAQRVSATAQAQARRLPLPECGGTLLAASSRWW